MASRKKALKKIRLNTSPDVNDLRHLHIGDIVYLDGIVYTGREGVYTKVIDQKAKLPIDLPNLSGTNFHCSPAASVSQDGSYNVKAVTATASFRFSKWLEQWFKISGAKLIIGKGGMSENDYKKNFIPNAAIYLTTVGYGTGALLGRGIKKVLDAIWIKELGIAQAMWILKVENFGPFIVESDLDGNSLFERENKIISKNLDSVYAGTERAILSRFGETDDRSEELI
ncbi:MAG: fumarate hydratase [Magnetovibrio sp.]|nr:fumarate hydratase [Magnetovibrio sp.]|tara:strand:- start:92 stop:772 length:681 start_codon:yes stop_codon:yes gene_type:complete